MRFPSTLVTSALALVLGLTLAACGGSGGSSGVAVTPATEVWVDAQNGNDADAGTQALPFKTLTHALAAAGAGTTLHVMPGTYDTANGETFPLQTLPGQILLGDVANRGMGMTATRIEGEALLMNGQHATIFMEESTRLAGFEISGTGYVVGHYAVQTQGNGVEIDENTFANPTYAGVRSQGHEGVDVHHNDFFSQSYATYLRSIAGAYMVRDNTFHTPAIPVDVHNSGSGLEIKDNLFIGSGQNGVHVQSGTPAITGNTFNKPTGYTYGAVYANGNSALPVLRGNTFFCTVAVHVNKGSADLGTAMDLGMNDFTGVTGVSIQHDAMSTIEAIGNTFPNMPPTNGGDIVITNGGTVIWGAAPGEQY